MVNRAHREALWVVLLAGGILISCVSERGIQPEPEKYRLYVSTRSANNRIFVFDVETDSLLDSSGVVGLLANIGRATPDGKFIIRARVSAPTEVLSTADLSIVAELPGCGTRHALATEEGLILGERLPSCLSYVSYPGFELIGSDTVVLEGNPSVSSPIVVDPTRGLMYLRLFFGDGSVDRAEVLAWDYRNRRVHDQWRIEGFSGASFTKKSGSDLLYTLGTSSGGASVFCYNLTTRQMVWDQPTSTPYCFLQLTPNGKELWRTERGDVLWRNIPGYVFVYDALTGAVLDSISLFGYLPWEGFPLAGQEIVFTPDGKKAYLAASDVSYKPGPVLVIDVAERKVTKVLFADLEHYPYYLSIAPAP